MSKVSVLLPTFNRPQWVGESIESILSQEGCDIELLILDNGSEPDTAAVLDRYTDPRIKRFRVEVNGSEGNHHSYLAKRATGQYIVLWTDDDVMIPGTLQKKCRFLDENPQIGAVYTPSLQNLGNEITSSPIGRPYHVDVLEDALPISMLIQANYVCMMTVVFRSEFLDVLIHSTETENGCSPLGDWSLWLEMASKTKFAYLNFESVIIRLHDNSDSNRRGMKEEGFMKYALRIWDDWLGRGIEPILGAWDRMRLGYLSYAVSTPGKDKDWLVSHVVKFDNFRKKWNGVYAQP